VFDHGTDEEDGPDTWEILCLSTDSFDGPLLVSFFHPLKSIMEEKAHDNAID